MRENRTYGSEGGEGQTLPDPYRRRIAASNCVSIVGLVAEDDNSDEVSLPVQRQLSR